MDFYKICRLCAKTPSDGSINPIFSKNSSIIVMKIQACCPLQLSVDDDLPTNVCTNCCEKLDEFFNFRMDMVSADNHLKSLIKEGKLVKDLKDPLALSIKEEIIVDETSSDHVVPIDVVLSTETEQSDFSNDTDDPNYSDNEPLSHKLSRIKKERKQRKSRRTSICPVCGKELRNRSFKEHMINVHDIGTPATPYHCNLCGKAFKTKQKMSTHKKTHSLIRISCDQCPKSFKTKAILDKHIKVSHLGIKDYTCNICDKAFGEKKHWKRHLLTHTGEKPFFCTICPRTFTNDWNCKKHIRNHNNNTESSSESEQEIKEEDAEPKKKPTAVCPVCGKELLKSSLAEHLANVHDIGIPPTTYECDICSKVLKTSQKLRTHKKTHHTVRYHCDQCEKTFKLKAVLDRHVKIIHLGIKEHICSVCDYAFGEKKHLKQHMISHSGEKPFICPICTKSFTNDWNCKMHVRRHKNIRPYTCELCDQTFIQNMELKSHVKRKHS